MAGAGLLRGWYGFGRSLSPAKINSLTLVEDKDSFRDLSSFTPEEVKEILLLNPKVFEDLRAEEKALLVSRLQSYMVDYSFPDHPEYDILKLSLSVVTKEPVEERSLGPGGVGGTGAGRGEDGILELAGNGTKLVGSELLSIIDTLRKSKETLEKECPEKTPSKGSTLLRSESFNKDRGL
jgi:hypothetical protein